MVRCSIVACAILLAGSSPATVADSDLGKQLTDHYRDQVLILRHSFKSDFQNYDANGSLQNYFPEGSWTVYGRIIVKKMMVEPRQLRVEGRRAFYEFERKQGRLVLFRSSDRVKVSIALSGPLASAADASTVLARVFASSPDDVLTVVPEYWRRYLQKQPVTGKESKPNQNSDSDLHGAPEGEKIFHLADPGVARPEPQYTPEPSFTEAARKALLQGTATLEIVVDKTGKVSDIQIVRPLGLGLDDNAAETIRTWRFTPATFNGEPVSTVFTVEVSFHLG